MATADDAMRVVLATDGSVAAGTAVELVENLAWPPGTQILVAQAVDTGPGPFGGQPARGSAQADSLEAEIRSEAEGTVREACERLARGGLNAESVVLTGRAATAIVQRATAIGADLIVVGSRGHGRIESMLLGSVSAEVVDHALAPVLVARARGIERIVLAWDGSSSAAGAAALLHTWPIFAGSRVRVVSVSDVEVPWWTGLPDPGARQLVPIYVDARRASLREHERLLHEMTVQLEAAGLSAEGDLREGDAATEILAAARATGADLIVMGTHGRTGLARVLLGSVARNVLQHASCSVLVVREVVPRADDLTASENAED